MNDPTNWRLCLDFGTAFCKAAACAPGNAPELLRIADAAGQGTGSRDGTNASDYMLETAAVISDGAMLSFGRRAVNASDGRRVWRQIKDPLTRANDPDDLDQLLPRQFNPTRVDVSMRDMIVLYLAFLTQAAVVASSTNGRVGRSMVRAVTTPAFEADKVAWVNAELGSLLARAEAVRLRFGNRLFSGVPLQQALECSHRSQAHNVDPDLVADGTTEPVASFAARLLHFTPQEQRLANVIMVVDIGAGTTDFALFASGLRDNRMTVRHIEHSHRSVPVAGNMIDDALVAHALSTTDIANRSDADEIRGKLNDERREIKEELFDHGTTTRILVGTTIRLRLDEFLASAPMREIVGRLKSEFDAVLRDVLPARHGGRVVVYFSGGGAGLPFLKQFLPVSDTSFTNADTGRSGLVRLIEPKDPRPSWFRRAPYASLWRNCGGERESPDKDYFGRVAVALGGAYFVAVARDWLHLDRTMWWPRVTREDELLRVPLSG